MGLLLGHRSLLVEAHAPCPRIVCARRNPL
jgi:hypothetical protein